MAVISLTPLDLTLCALLIAALALISIRMQLGLEKRILIAGLRTTVQLLLIGLVLKSLFAYVNILYMVLIALVMLFVAGFEVMRRQKRRFTGLWGFGTGTGSMCISAFSVTLFAIVVIIGVDPWYDPQYAIPLLGMLLGNTMNGVSLGLDRLTQEAWDKRHLIEGRLMTGETGRQAIEIIRKDSIRSGLIPIINSMSVVGLVSLPGMMTGQILAGSPPVEAVKYQILIMFLIAGGTGFGVIFAVWIGAKRLFDDRDRLRLDRLTLVEKGSARQKKKGKAG